MVMLKVQFTEKYGNWAAGREYCESEEHVCYWRKQNNVLLSTNIFLKYNFFQVIWILFLILERSDKKTANKIPLIIYKWKR